MQKLLGAFVLYKCLYWIIGYGLLFSDNTIVYSSYVELSWWRLPVFYLFNSNSQLLSVIFILVSILSAIGVIVTKNYSRILFFVLWFAVSNINNKVFCTLSGGDYLLQHLLFFATFLEGKEFTGVKRDWSMMFHNTGVLALKIQMCFVYAMAGLTKLLDPDWMGGTAVYDVFKISDFSLSFMNTMDNNIFITLLNYSVVFYQLLFPVLVWIKPIQKWYLLIGVMQHLFISLIIGLPSFGFIMLIAYAIFHKPSFGKGN